MATPQSLILTINSGSSSIKTSLYRLDGGEQLIAVGQIEGIGREQGRFRMSDAAGQELAEQTLKLPDHTAALTLLFDWLKGHSLGGAVSAVGHRVVHGGPKFKAPSRVSAELIAEVRKLIPLDPLHLPSEIAAIEAVERHYPGTPQVAC